MKSTLTMNLRRVALSLSLGACAWTQVIAATDLANAPLSNTMTVAKPNLLFILDDSGSMNSDYMPDNVSDMPSYTLTYGYRSTQCNGLAYNPNLTYKPPISPVTPPSGSTESRYPDMSITAAWGDGYQPAISTSSRPGLRSDTALNMSASGTGVSKTLTIASSTDNTLTVAQALAKYTSNPTVVLTSYDTVGSTTYGKAAHWMMGTVTGYTSSTITINVTFSTADASSSYSHWYLGVPSTSDLSARYYYTYSGSQPTLGWTYDTSGAVVANTFYNECKATSGSAVFTKVLVSSLSSAQQTNYANWYSYYRKRIMAIRAAAGSSFNAMSDDFRVGMTLISDTDVVAGQNGFVPVSDFNTAQRTDFYASLYSAPPSSYTPLRGALSKAGRYYANKARGQSGNLVSGQTTATPDPVQYTCQRNYALLSTDGYWNTPDEDSSKGYGPYKVDGTTLVGQQDGLDSRPQYDGSSTVVTTVSNVGYTYQSTTPYTINYRTTTTASKLVYSYTRVKIGSYYTYTQTVTSTPVSSYVDSSTATTQTNTYTSQQTRTVTETTTESGTTTTTTYSPAQPPAPSLTGSSRSAETAVSTGTATAWATTGGSSTVSILSCTTSSKETCTNFKAYLNKSYDFTAGYTLTQAGTPTTSYGSQSVGSPVKQNEVAGTTTTGTQTAFDTQVSATTTSTSANSLADVAEYYYKTPFRVDATVNCNLQKTNSACSGDLSPSEIDNATYQHMTTFTLGLGVNGLFKYDPDYQTQTAGDYFDVKRGKNNAGTAVNWPLPYNTSNLDLDIPGKIDDLWHAAVNGRGMYFNASDTAALSTALTKVITRVQEASGYSGSAAASSLKPLVGTDLLYLASYTTVDWTGDVQAFSIQEKSSTDKTLMTNGRAWSAAATLNARDYTTRKIYYAGSGSGGGGSSRVLREFNATNLSADGYDSYFANVCSKTPTPLQCSTLSDTLKTQLNSSSNVIDFLRGDRSKEISVKSPSQPFRMRASVMGDVVNASPVFVGTPPFQYTDDGYTDYVAARSARKKVVYAAANDGMLHALRAEATNGGAELWAFVPTAVLPNLYRLTDTNYKNNHVYFVDGSPTVGDVYDREGEAWHTVLVGGLNKGGKSYYALDVTDPDNPALLWEISNTQSDFANLGYTYGNPVITKVKDPADANKWIWAVVFASGHNNTDNGGDGNGTLYVVNAMTGARLYKVDTTYKVNGNTTKAGSSSTPSGLAKINAWITAETNNRAERFYGADLLGNVWRFDVNGSVEPKNSALLLAQLRSTAGSTDYQPVQTRPELYEMNYGGVKYPVVIVGTGQYLGSTDLSNTATQAIYAIKDPMTSTGWGPIRGHTDLVTRTLVDVSGRDDQRKLATPMTKVDWSRKIGWTVALPSSKERVAIDMNLQLDTLGVVSHVPEGTACAASGHSWVYFLDVGAQASTSPLVGTLIRSGLGTGITWLDQGASGSTVLVPDDKLGINSRQPPTSSGGESKTQRVSWRELVN